MAKVIFNGTVVAESDDTVVVEGNHYFPRESLRRELFTPNGNYSTCSWKGEASYMTLTVDGATAEDCGWFYPAPLEGAEAVADRVAFYGNIVEIEV